MELKILILKKLRLEKMKFQKVNILVTHMKLLVELKKIKRELLLMDLIQINKQKDRNIQ
jgi:hypothetical protein